MLARSHFVLAVASYLALLSHPPAVATPGGTLVVPVVRLTEGVGPADPVLPVALSVAVVAVGALAPDLDSAGSAAARSLGPLSRLPARAVQLLLHHRGPLHSALAVLGAGVLGGLLGARLGLAGIGAALAYGWGTHVLADALTDRGVPLLWPLWRRRVRLPFGLGPATGGLGEAVLVVGGLLGCVAWGALGLAA